MTTSSPSSSKPQRDLRLDLLKVLGLMGIITAHAIYRHDSHPIAQFLLEFRNFDVPLMVLISGILFAKSAPAEGIPWNRYLRKRIPRLIAPVWMFLILFFALGGLFSLMAEQPYPFSFRDMLGSFLLINYISIGYVWIIRAFVLVALVAPLLWYWKQKLNNTRVFLALLAGVFLLYDGISRPILAIDLDAIAPDARWLNIIIARIILFLIIHQVFFYLIPFSCIFALGMVIPDVKQKTQVGITLGLATIYAILAYVQIQAEGAFVSTYIDKFPPQIYYTSYGIFMSLLFYLGLQYFHIHSSIRQSRIVKGLTASIQFISQSSMWIYLWHIAFIYYGNVIFAELPIENNALHRWLWWAVGSVTITLVQKTLVSAISHHPAVGSKAQKQLSILFLK